MGQVDTQATATFLSALYGNLPEGQAQFLIWTLPAKQSAWFDDPLQAAAHVKGLGKSADVYCSVGLEPEDRGAGKRTSNATICGMIGFAADVDIRDDTTSKSYPPTVEDALDLMVGSGLPPSVVVHSGHGLQGWWLFREPWIFETDDEREKALALAKAWGLTIKEHATRRGWQVDSVFDGARVMRVPGTFNHKRQGSVVKVTLLHEAYDMRFNPIDFEEWLLVPPEAPKPEAAPAPQLAFATSEHLNEFPWQKHEALLINSPEYLGAWSRTSDDQRDRSASGWDMTLANLGVHASLTDEEILEILVAARKRHNNPIKRVEYYQTTIGKARSGSRLAADGTDDVPREDRIAAIARGLAIPLTDIQLITGTNPLYRFMLDLGERTRAVELTPAAVLNQSTFRNGMFTLTKVPPRRIGKNDIPPWDDYVKAIAGIATEIDTGDDATVDGELRALVDEYLTANRPQEMPPGKVVEEPNHPFIREGRVWIRASNLYRFATLSLNMRLERAVMIQRLHVAGAVRQTMKVKKATGEEAQTTASFYGLARTPSSDED